VLLVRLHATILHELAGARLHPPSPPALTSGPLGIAPEPATSLPCAPVLYDRLALRLLARLGLTLAL
jgi:hypothetical protein